MAVRAKKVITEVVEEKKPSSSLIPDEQEYKKVVNHIVTLTNLGVWAWKQDSGVQTGYGGCHSGCMNAFTREGNYSKYKYFASCADWGDIFSSYYNSITQIKEIREVVEEYLVWLLGPDSPWAGIHLNDVELIRHEGIIRGFILGPTALSKKDNGAGIYNLLIAARCMRDHYQMFKNYKDLREIGLSILSAFLLCLYFQKSGSIWTYTNNFMQAAHTPLKEYEFIPGATMYDRNGMFIGYKLSNMGLILDIKALKNKEYNTNLGTAQRSSHGWMRKPQEGDFLFQDLIKEVGFTKTKFSSVQNITPEIIIGIADRIENV